MDLVLIFGSGAVGKMTVGQELMKLTGYRLFHNHMMIEPVIEIFGSFRGQAVNALREVVFDEFLKTELPGMIFTYMWAFDMPSDWEYLDKLTAKFQASGGTVYYVELVADQAVRLQRNATENRLINKASKRDVAASNERLMNEDKNHRLVSEEGELQFPHYLRIDNTTLPAREVAEIIQREFELRSSTSENA